MEALTPDDVLMFTDSFDDDSKIDYFKSTNVHLNTHEGWITTQTNSIVVSEEIPIDLDQMWSVIFISLSLHEGSVDIQILDGCTLDPILPTNITSGGEYDLNYLGIDFDISPYAHPTIRIKVDMSNSGSLGPRIHLWQIFCKTMDTNDKTHYSTINTYEKWENSNNIIYLSEDLIINSNLDITDCKIHFTNDAGTVKKIHVNLGGKLSINNTIISSHNSTNNYYVKIQDEFHCNRTIFKNLWADNELINNMLGDGGIQIMDSDTTITNSTVMESNIGFNIQGSNPYINNCEIYKITYRHYYMTNSNPVIESTPIYKENIYSNDMLDSDSDQILDYLEKYVYHSNFSSSDSDNDQILDTDEIVSNIHYIEAEDIAINEQQVFYDEELNIEYLKITDNKLIIYKTDLPCGLYKILLFMKGTPDSSIRLGLEDASFYQADPSQVFERGKIYYLDNPQFSWVGTNIIKNDNEPYISILIDRISGSDIKLDKIMIVKLSNGFFEFAGGNQNFNIFPGSTQDKQYNISVPISVGLFSKARFTFILNHNIQTGPITSAEYEIFLGTTGPNFQIGHIIFNSDGEKNYFMLDNFSYELNNWVSTHQGQAENGYLEIPIIVKTKSNFPLSYIIRDLVITYNESYNIGKITHPLMNDSDQDGISDYTEVMDFFLDLDATDYTNWNRYHVDEIYDKDAIGSKALHIYMTQMDDPVLVPLIDEESTLEMNSDQSTKFRVLIRAKKGKGIYNAYILAKVTDYNGNSIFSESVGLSRSLTTEYRWYHTSLFEMNAYTNFKVNISANLYGNEGSHFYLDKVYVVGAIEGLEFFTRTNVLCPDTDKDDIVDGVENSLNSIWIEAEDLYTSPYSIEYLDKSASNSKSLKVDCSSSSNIVDSSKMNSMINDKNLNYGKYSMMIRGKYGISGNANLTVTVDGPSYTTTIYGGEYRWYSFPVKFDLNGNNNFQITQDDHYSTKIQIDKILIIKDNLMKYQYTDPYDHDIDFDGLKDGMEFNENIMSFNIEDFSQYPKSEANLMNQKAYLTRTLQSTHSDLFMFNDLPLSDYYCKIKMKLDGVEYFHEDSINLQIKDNSSTVIVNEDIQIISESRWYITEYFNINNTSLNDITMVITYTGDQSIELLIDTVQFISVQDNYNLFTNKMIDPISPYYSDVDYDGFLDSKEICDGRLWLEAENYMTSNGSAGIEGHASNGRYTYSNSENEMLRIVENLIPGNYYIGIAVKKANTGQTGYANLSVFNNKYSNISIYVEYERYSVYYLENVYLDGKTIISLEASNSDIYIDRILIIQTTRKIGNRDIYLNTKPTNPVIFNNILYRTYPDSLSDPFSRNYDFDWIPTPEENILTKYSDEDELSVSEYKYYLSDPLNNDKDNDGISDYDELSSDIVTDPCNPDTDNDLIPDGWIDGWSYNKKSHTWGICSYFKNGFFDDLGSIYGDNISVEGEVGPNYNGSIDTIPTENIGGVDYITSPLPNNQDTDNDGLIDGYEILFGTDPCDSDTDDDGLSDYYEIRTHWGGDENIYVTDPLNPDSDFDGLTDGLEMGFDEGCEPILVLGIYYVKGTDDSWIGDSDISTTTNPTNHDTDGDGLPDGWIDGWNFNYTDRNIKVENVTYSIDNQFEPGEAGFWGKYNDVFDNVTYKYKTGPIYHYPSYPVSYQSIGSVYYDGLAQPWEGEDRDLDGKVDLPEKVENKYKWNKTQDNTTKDNGEYYETDPNLLSTDGGIASDSLEILASYSDDYGGINWSRSFNPLDDDDDLTLWSWSNLKDLDGDGLMDFLEDFNCNGRFDPNGTEAYAETNLFDIDTDDDGLPDGFEMIIGTNPKKFDTDGDGLSDGVELRVSQPMLSFENIPYWINGTNHYLFQKDYDLGTSTDPLDVDTDNDGLPDGWIDGWGYHKDKPGHPDSIPGWGPYYIAYNTLDNDGDGYSNQYEIECGTNLSDPGDYPGGNKNVISSSHLDWDGDGYSNHMELLTDTDPNDAQSHPDPEYHTKDTASYCYEDGIQQPWEGEDFNLNGKQERFISSTELKWEYNKYIDIFSNYVTDRDFDGYTNYTEEIVWGLGNDSNPNIKPKESDNYLPDSLYHRYNTTNDTFFIKKCNLLHKGVETSPVSGNNDTNFDGIDDGESILRLIDPFNDDHDGDGIKNIDERLIYHTNQFDLDTDRDGINDYIEVNFIYENCKGSNKTNPLINDTDNDGLLDGWERKYYLEYPGTEGTWLNPCNRDSDGDGISDGWETQDFHCLLNGIPQFIEDHVRNIDEQSFYGNPSSTDTDSDGLTDYEELMNGTALNNRDTDGDMLWDYEEIVRYNTNPLVPDSDGDGVTDYYEILYGTDPNNAMSCDSDFDGVFDSYDILVDQSKNINFNWTDTWMRGMIEKTFKIKTIYLNNTVPKSESGKIFRYSKSTFDYGSPIYDGAATISYNPGPSFEDVEKAIQKQYNFPRYNITELEYIQEDQKWTETPYRTAKGPLYPTTYEIDYEIRDREYEVTIINNQDLKNWFDDPYGYDNYKYYYTGNGNGDLLKLGVEEGYSQVYTIQLSMKYDYLFTKLENDYSFVQPTFKYTILSPSQNGDFYNSSRYENWAMGIKLHDGYGDLGPSYEYKINIPREVASSTYIDLIDGKKYVNIALCPVYTIEDEDGNLLQFPVNPSKINRIGGIEYKVFGKNSLLIVRNDKDFHDYTEALFSSIEDGWNTLTCQATGLGYFTVSEQNKYYYNYNPLVDSGNPLESDTDIDIIIVHGNSEDELMKNLFKQKFTESNWIVSGKYNISNIDAEFYQMSRNIISWKTNEIINISGKHEKYGDETKYIKDVMRLYYNVNTLDPKFQPEGLTLPNDDEIIYKFSKLKDNGTIYIEVNEFKSVEEYVGEEPTVIDNNIVSSPNFGIMISSLHRFERSST